MKKRIFIALLMFLLTFAIHAPACADVSAEATAKEEASADRQDQRAIDSLTTVIREAKHDTSTAAAYVELSDILYISYLDTVIPLCIKAKEISERNLAQGPPPTLKKKYLLTLASALNNIGYIYGEKGEIQKQSEYYHKSLKIYEEIGNKKGIAVSLNNIGYIYENQGDIPKGLEYYHKSLKIQEEIDDKKGIAGSLNNIGYIYKNQGDIPKGLEYYHKSLKIQEEIGNKKGIAGSLNNIGMIYNNQGVAATEASAKEEHFTKALEYFHKSLKIREEIGDKNGIATSLNNIGYIYRNQGDIPKGLEYYHKSLKIYEELGDKKGIAISLNNIGVIELERGALTSALNYGMRGLEIAREIGSPRRISMSSRLMSKVAKKQGNLTTDPVLRQARFQEALEMYELHILMRDSIKNEETQKASIRQQTKYEFEKAQLVKEQEEKEAARIIAEETSRRDNLQYSVILIAILVLFGGVLSLGFINVSEKMAEGIIFFSFLILFEFLLVLADPYIENWSDGAPGIKLLFNAGIAALIFPAHAFFESRLKGRLVKSST